MCSDFVSVDCSSCFKVENCALGGDPVRRGDNQEILPTIWSHRDFLLDAEAGDLVQWNDGSDPIHRSRARLVRWRAIYPAPQLIDSGISGEVSDQFMGLPQW